MTRQERRDLTFGYLLLGYECLRDHRPSASSLKRPTMHPTQFDAITKAWARFPRRRVLGGIGAGALGPLLGLGRREASAVVACQRSRDCPGGQVCINKSCVSKCEDPGTCKRGFTLFGCQNDPNCFCGKKPDGGGLCMDSEFSCDNVIVCTKQRHCPTGLICAAGCCSEQTKFTCQPPCAAAN